MTFPITGVGHERVVMRNSNKPSVAGYWVNFGDEFPPLSVGSFFVTLIRMYRIDIDTHRTAFYGMVCGTDNDDVSNTT